MIITLFALTQTDLPKSKRGRWRELQSARVLLAVKRERPGGRGFRLVIKPSSNGYVNKWNVIYCAKLIYYLHGLVTLVIWRMPANRGQTAFCITFIQNGSLINYINLPEPANFWRNNPYNWISYYNWISCLKRGEMSESTNINAIINQSIITLSEWI